ncbi:hypothetical protein E3N88_45810 [Mikania micrantha]|uniref:Uncharacterized protein n=1 Tax=Mikania micrantha TaxID=192012 RepID=A0A5N6L877_9ASTR|nr:hypothetical protein E3N88_45810 [Mikania micrantha]
MTPMMVASVDLMLLRWKELVGSEVEVHEEFRMLTAEQDFFKTRDDLKSDELQNKIHNLIMETIDERHKMMGDADDFLGQLLMAKSNNQLSMQDIIDECKHFMSLGMEQRLLSSHGLFSFCRSTQNGRKEQDRRYSRYLAKNHRVLKA